LANFAFQTKPKKTTTTMIAFILIALLASRASAQYFNRQDRIAVSAVLEGFGYTIQNNPDFRCSTQVVGVVGCTWGEVSKVVSLNLRPHTPNLRVKSVPTQIGLLTDLVKLEINGLYGGTIPTQIADLPRLTELRMFNTLLLAPVPSELDLPNLDCLIESSVQSNERYKCTSCKPTRSCLVHPPDDCYDSCYLLEGNETLDDIRGTPRDADINFNFEEEFGEQVRLAKLASTTAQAMETKRTSVAHTTSSGDTISETGSQGSVRATLSPSATSGDVMNESISAQSRSPDYTVVYIISAVLGFIVIMTLVGLGVYFAIMKRPVADDFGNPLQRSNSAETRYTSVSHAVAPYGESSFAHLQ